MIKVWILVIIVGGYREYAPAVIEDIATGDECSRVAKLVLQTPAVRNVRCIEVWKVKEK